MKNGVIGLIQLKHPQELRALPRMWLKIAPCHFSEGRVLEVVRREELVGGAAGGVEVVREATKREVEFGILETYDFRMARALPRVVQQPWKVDFIICSVCGIISTTDIGRSLQPIWLMLRGHVKHVWNPHSI